MKQLSLDFILFLFLIILFVFLIRADIYRINELEARNRVLENEIRAEKTRKADLKAYLGRLNSGTNAESIARARLGMIKSGESAYKVIRKGSK